LFDPCPEEKWFFGNMILQFAGVGASAAADALFDIYADPVPHSARVFRFFGSKYHTVERLKQRGGKNTSTYCHGSR
jgi:hypothetical protein